MNQQDLLKLKEDFGYNKLSYKYIPAGSEILRYIGQAVVVVTFKKIWRTEKDEEGNDVKKYSLEDHMERGFLLSLNNFDPMTKTYLCKYKIDGQEEEKETRIQPEGFEFVNLDDEKVEQSIRLVPYSYHCRMVEDEFTQARIKDLFEKRDTLNIEELKMISESKNQGEVLRYAHNVIAAIKMEDGTIFGVRIWTLRLKHRQGTKYGLFFSGEGNRELSTIISSEDKVYKLGDYGEMKIIDLSD